MDNYYYGNTPNLIGPIMKTTVTKIIKNPVVNNTISDKVTSFVSDFYGSYIAENKLIIFILLLIILFLGYRYYQNKNKNNRIETIAPNISDPEVYIDKYNEKSNLYKQLQYYQLKNKELDEKIMELNKLKDDVDKLRELSDHTNNNEILLPDSGFYNNNTMQPISNPNSNQFYSTIADLQSINSPYNAFQNNLFV